MIYYFPYTYLPINRLRFLCRCFSRLSVFQTSEISISDDMQQLVDQQYLDIRFPRKVESGRLQAVFDEYIAWAGMHSKRPGDLKNFFKANQNRPPLVDETHPTQIQSQIRRFNRDSGANPDDSQRLEDPQLQAALFLSLAHRFDEHQDTLSTKLGTVRKMEKRMFARLSGEDNSEAVSAVFSTDPPKMTSINPVDEFGDYRVAERIQAFATLAADDPGSIRAYVTTSPEVAEAVLDIFPESIGLAHWNLERFEEIGKDGCRRLPDVFKKIKELAFSETLPLPEKIPMPEAGLIDPAETNVRFLLFGVPRCSPRQALGRIITGETGSDESLSSNPVALNTLFGLITGV